MLRCHFPSASAPRGLRRSPINMRNFSRRSGGQDKKVHHSGALKLTLGGSLPEVEIAWEQWGMHNQDVVFLCPSLSMGSHAHSTVNDPTPGWWEGIIGPGASFGIDTDRYHVICASGLGGPFGTTSPLSTNPQTGVKYRKSFPQITPRDIALCHHRLLEHLKVKKLHALVGASLGGMVALHFAAEFPAMAERVLAISCTPRSTPGSVALRRIQRHAVLLDPNYNEGNYGESCYPTNGMTLARELGMVTYRSLPEFNHRFSWAEKEEVAFDKISFEVESYLQTKGEQFAAEFDPNCYLLLSKCTDLMNLGRGFKTFSEGVLRIGSVGDPKVLLIGAQLDMLIPASELERLAMLLEAHGRSVQFQACHSIYGHDAFLLDDAWFAPRIRAFMADKPLLLK